MSKIGYFSIFLFLSILGQENVFHDILQQKNGLLGFKNKKFKKSKNWDICKGVNPWFRSKLAFFCTFLFLSIIGQENVFYNILERKNAFLNYKSSMFKKWKNCDFCKGVNPWFWSKIGYFSIFFFFKDYRRGKCVLRYSRTKKRLPRPYKQKVQKVEKLRFLQRG